MPALARGKNGVEEPTLAMSQIAARWMNSIPNGYTCATQLLCGTTFTGFRGVSPSKMRRTSSAVLVRSSI